MSNYNDIKESIERMKENQRNEVLGFYEDELAAIILNAKIRRCEEEINYQQDKLKLYSKNLKSLGLNRSDINSHLEDIIQTEFYTQAVRNLVKEGKK